MSVAAAFARASDYDRYAIVQRDVACSLAETIRSLNLPPSPRVLELGCGTGFLGAALIRHLPGAHWCMTDIADPMVERARKRFSDQGNITFRCLDAQAPKIDGPFDLICSSLAFQWLPDLPHSVSSLCELLSPEGYLAFTTLARGTFSTWQMAHGDIPSGTPFYPSPEDLTRLGLEVSTTNFEAEFDDALQFLHGIKAIGAGTAREGYRALGPSRFKEVMACFERLGTRAEYVVATCIGKSGSGRT